MKDRCCWCKKEMELTDKTRIVIGKKTDLEWYVCVKCQDLATQGMDAIDHLVQNEDEDIYAEEMSLEEAKP